MPPKQFRTRGKLPTPHSSDRAERIGLRRVEFKRGVAGRRKTAVVVNLSSMLSISHSVRAALQGYRRSPVTVYDASGKAIDAETRERKPL